VEPTMTRRPLLALLFVLTAVGLVVGTSIALPAAHAATPTSPVTGTIVGPSLVATLKTLKFTLNATGGPADAPNGSRIGNITYHIGLAASNLTGVSVSPSEGAIVTAAPAVVEFAAGTNPETVVITVEYSSTYKTENVSINITHTVTIVQPYVISATIYNVAGTTVLGFPLTIDLDGQPVGTVNVPSLTPHGQYNLSFDYATVGLSSGDHTFSISLVGQHGLVRFAGGAQSYSVTVYVVGPPPNYSLWYVVGVVAFLGVLFIFLTRVAARRRGALRK
jgi:hypothetical protein